MAANCYQHACCLLCMAPTVRPTVGVPQHRVTAETKSAQSPRRPCDVNGGTLREAGRVVTHTTPPTPDAEPSEPSRSSSTTVGNGDIGVRNSADSRSVGVDDPDSEDRPTPTPTCICQERENGTTAGAETERQAGDAALPPAAATKAPSVPAQRQPLAEASERASNLPDGQHQDPSTSETHWLSLDFRDGRLRLAGSFAKQLVMLITITLCALVILAPVLAAVTVVVVAAVAIVVRSGEWSLTLTFIATVGCALALHIIRARRSR
jgi:hypothetical protein